MHGGPQSAASLSGRSHTVSVKLPKLTLKRFNGDLTRWTTFWDSFKSAIHDNSGLSDVDQFNYLNSQLEGPASEAIAGLKLTAANYGEAIAILQKRFGNKQQIIRKHMDVLLSIGGVASQHNLKGLRHLHDLVESQVRGLRALGVPSKSYGSLLSSVLMNKLPPELRLIIGRETAEGDFHLDELMKVFQRELDARERTSATASSGQSLRRPSKVIMTATAMVSSTTTLRCCYCGQPHLSTMCESITGPEERKGILMKSGRCFVCLKRYHRSRDCRSSMKCLNCNGRHHVSICTRVGGGNTRAGMTERNSSASTHSGTSNQPSTPPKPVSPVPSVAVHYVGAKVPVLLQIARTRVHKLGNPRSTVAVRVLFDSGSQRSYVTERAVSLYSVTHPLELMRLLST